MTTTTSWDQTGSERDAGLEVRSNETSPKRPDDSVFLRCATFSRMGSNKVTPYVPHDHHHDDDPNNDFSFQKSVDGGTAHHQQQQQQQQMASYGYSSLVEVPKAHEKPKETGPRVRSTRLPKVKADDPPKRLGCTNPRRSICLSSVLIIFLLLGTVTFLMAYYRPKLPILEMGDVNVSKFSTAALGPSFQVNMSADFSMQIFNSNGKAKVYYKDVSVSMYYRGEILGSTLIPAFKQKEKTWATIDGAVNETRALVETQSGVTHLKDQLNKSEVTLELRAMVQGQFKILDIPLQEFDMPVECKLTVNPGDGATEQPLVTSQNCFYMTPMTVMM
ncbi:hypothetical protein Mapa_015570 [Marchantia paleacea]|nr:hypothetical protein Mapa_015570 [Marchantia paleacea]